MRGRFIHFVCLVLVLSLVGTCAVSGADLGSDPNLVGRWKLDNDANDSSGGARHGTARGSPLPPYVAGPTYGAGLPFYAGNSAISLGGVTPQQYVELPIGDVISKLTDCTFALWVNYRQSGGGSRWQRIFDFGSAPSTAPTNYMALLPRRSSSAPTHFEINVNGTVQRVSYGPYSSAGTTIPTFTWVHIAVTIDDVNDIFRLYVNGQQVGETTGATFAPIDLGVTTYNWLGRSLDTDVEGPYFPGYLDDFRIYNRVLSPDEIKQAMGVPIATFPTPANGAILPVGTATVDLKWVPGAAATKGNHLYFGSNRTDVDNGTGGTDKGLVGSTTYTVTNLVPGPTYYWRVDSVGDPNVVRGDMWSFRILPTTSWNPTPANDAQYVSPKMTLRWAAGSGAVKGHNVYLADNYDQVNNAPAGSTTAPFVVFLTPTADPNWTPARSGVTLAYNRTYYWRVDEVESQSPVKTYKGEVWKFTTVPTSPPVSEPNLVGWWKFDGDLLDSSYGCDGTAYGGPTYDTGAIGSAMFFNNTSDTNVDNDIYVNLPIGSVISSLTNCTFTIWVNWLGSTNTRINQRFFCFSTTPENSMYLAPSVSASAPTNFQIASGGLFQMVGYGSNTANLGTLIPTNDWHHLAVTINADTDTFRLYLDGQQVGERTGSTLTPSSLGWTTNNWLGRSESPVQQRPYWGYLDDFRIYDKVLSEAEIRKVMVRLTATDPRPRNRAAGVGEASVLTWVAGDKAVQHDVYFGTDANAVTYADTTTAGVYRGRQPATSYTPTELPYEWGRTYYWRIDEVNETDPEGLWRGNVWSFTVANYLIIDEFEDYNNYPPDRVFETWIDGYDNPTVNGSLIGHPDPDFAAGQDFAETAILHGGNQSMPYYYDCNMKYSEAVMMLAGLNRDWTRHDLKSLSIWFRGYPATQGRFAEGPAGTFTMTGAGSDIWAIGGVEADEFHFAWKMLSGPGSITAKVNAITGTNLNAWAKAGVMIRETLDPNSAHAHMLLSNTNGIAFQYRAAAAGASANAQQKTTISNRPLWLKLDRAFDGTFTASHANDVAGAPDKWTAMTTVNIQMSLNVRIGLALTSHQAYVPAQVTFSNVTFNGNVTGLQWTDQDIGIRSNRAERMFVAIQGTTGPQAIVYHTDPNATLLNAWTEWNIPMTAFAGINLQDVDKISLGFSTKGNPGPGGSGLVYFDDIRAYAPRCLPALLKPAADFDDDCIVNMRDLRLMAIQWLQTGAALEPDLDQSQKVDFKDYSALADSWLTEQFWP